jgi:hypothetical protein
MRPRKKIHSRRCCVCRNWFSPNPRAAHAQQTCSAKCRKAHRSEQARDRRAKDPERFRAAERARQARRRTKKRRASDGDARPPATQRLPVWLGERLEIVLALALSSPPPSRAALGEALQSLACACVARSEAGAWTARGRCHAPASAAIPAWPQGKVRGFAHEGAVSRACFAGERHRSSAIFPLESGKSARDAGAVSRAGFGFPQRRNGPLSRAGIASRTPGVAVSPAWAGRPRASR